MRTCIFVLMLTMASAAFAVESPQWATKDLRAGIIGTDTSHVPAFTGAFQSHPQWRVKVMAAFKGGSPDLPTSADITTGRWKDGRVGIYYGPPQNEKQPVIRIWGTEGATESAGSEGYDGLVQAIAQFFQTGRPPVDPAETIELCDLRLLRGQQVRAKGIGLVLGWCSTRPTDGKSVARVGGGSLSLW